MADITPIEVQALLDYAIELKISRLAFIVEEQDTGDSF